MHADAVAAALSLQLLTRSDQMQVVPLASPRHARADMRQGLDQAIERIQSGCFCHASAQPGARRQC